jgi:hypothetical protein
LQTTYIIPATSLTPGNGHHSSHPQSTPKRIIDTFDASHESFTIAAPCPTSKSRYHDIIELFLSQERRG